MHFLLQNLEGENRESMQSNKKINKKLKEKPIRKNKLKVKKTFCIEARIVEQKRFKKMKNN